MADRTHSTPSVPAVPDTPRDQPRAGTRATRRLARQITAFAARHGGSADAVVEYLGARGSRIVLVGGDGRWGDLIAPSQAVATEAVTRAGVTVHDTFEGEFAGRLRTGRYEWTRMAGIQLPGPAGS